MEPNLLLTLLVAGLASAFMAWVIGAGSSGATPFAPAVGADAIPVMKAALVVGVFGFAGAALQGGNVSQTVGNGLIVGTSLSMTAIIVALATAASLMAVGVFTGVPIATAFTVTGAIIGAGLALGGRPAWAQYGLIGGLWLFAPVFTGSVAYTLASLLPRKDVPERLSLALLSALVGVIGANVRFGPLGPGGSARSIAATIATVLDGPSVLWSVGVTVLVATVLAAGAYRAVLEDEARALRVFLLGLGSIVAFSAGGSQVGLAVGPLLPLLDVVDVSRTAILVGGGLGLLVGSWTGAPRMIKSISQDYASLGPRRSISALFPAFVVAQVAVLLGVPISFNEIIVSAIVGSGLAVGGSAGVSRSKLLKTAGAWVGSFALAFAVGYGVLRFVGG
ncbi:MAG: PiT family inorganic phosphate transporter [Halobacteriales archaeon]|jgi:PiT family inorganic phosphate transporter